MKTLIEAIEEKLKLQAEDFARQKADEFQHELDAIMTKMRAAPRHEDVVEFVEGVQSSWFRKEYARLREQVATVVAGQASITPVPHIFGLTQTANAIWKSAGGND